MDLLNDILAAVSVGLGVICPGIPVCVEDVPQRVPPRCFLIGYAGEVTVAPYPHGGRSVSGTIDITYFAPERGKEPEIKRELNVVFGQLSLGLSHVSYGGISVTLGRHRRTDDGKDGALRDLVSFRAFLYPVDTTPLMNDISIGKEEIK